jgi:hypothetical protein
MGEGPELKSSNDLPYYVSKYIQGITEELRDIVPSAMFETILSFSYRLSFRYFCSP